jgi:hypothetical protein
MKQVYQYDIVPREGLGPGAIVAMLPRGENLTLDTRFRGRLSTHCGHSHRISVAADGSRPLDLGAARPEGGVSEVDEGQHVRAHRRIPGVPEPVARFGA